ncbi:DUF1648 domain-containing protein [Fictibacillus sp. Mic-4]|uniref:DUF1648 domain-containing protein n=1 Tax=Fictibacillus sp. Mic-4 TaxID=3132826 RepID=UPI003CEF3556
MNKRPVLSIPKTALEKVLDAISILVIIATFCYLLYVWNDLPEQIPRHFDFAGRPDGWGTKRTIWIMPIVASVVFVFIFTLCKFPHVFNYPVEITEENAPRLYLLSRKMLCTINFEIVLFLSMILWEIIRVGFGKESFGIWFLPTFFIIVFGTIGITIYRIVRLR